MRLDNILKELKQCTLVGIKNHSGIVTVMYVEHEKEIPSSIIESNTEVKSYYWVTKLLH